MEHRSGDTPGLRRWIKLEESAQHGAGVADLGWYGAVQDARVHVVESREGVDAISCTLVRWAPLLPPCAVLVNVEG